MVAGAEFIPAGVLLCFRRIGVDMPVEPIGEPVDVSLLRSIAGLWTPQIVKGKGNMDHFCRTTMSLHQSEHIPIGIHIGTICLETKRRMHSMSVHVG